MYRGVAQVVFKRGVRTEAVSIPLSGRLKKGELLLNVSADDVALQSDYQANNSSWRRYSVHFRV